MGKDLFVSFVLAWENQHNQNKYMKWADTQPAVPLQPLNTCKFWSSTQATDEFQWVIKPGTLMT